MRLLALPRALIGLLVVVAALGWSPRAHAFAWMIKHGFTKCGSCHTDPAGGETLTHFGRAESQFLLSAGGDGASEAKPSAQFLFGALREPENVNLGGSYRHMFLYSAAVPTVPSEFRHFPMQVDLYGSARIGSFVFGASLGVARGIEGSAHVRGAQLNQEDADGFIVLSRNHYVGLWLQEGALLRFGRLNLPFGVRLPEHTLWVREATRTDRESDQQHGVALSYSRRRWRGEMMLVMGNFQLNPDRFRERGYAGSIEYLLTPKLAVGGSSLLTYSQEDALTRVEDSLRYVHGVNARFGVSPKLALLGEFDLLKEQGRVMGMTGFLQADYEPWRGLHLALTGEVLDQGLLDRDDVLPVPGAGAARYGAWISLGWFPMTHLELRFDAVLRQDDVFHGLGQLHVYL
jgi:hypothetical protein